MATTHQEKQKRGFLNFYKSGTKKCTPKPEPIKDVSIIPTSQTSLPRKPKMYQETIQSPSWMGLEDDGRGRGGGNLVEARKSVSHVETNLASVASFLQVKVLVSDMPGFMQVHAFRCARRTYDSLEKFSSKHMAYNLKKEFDKVYGPAWHCIVGSSFGSFVTHSTGCFLYFSMEKLYILVFKTKVQRASH
ncbi:hypothetical protein Tsubulata_037995 [Turnera subulata]|uniref:Dynein light chain n=1 Tax=Turnera subulata TaxID=218843 RepID=A0A9Q0GB48_9ROSI|nr:hypothetical protein Tsubulata_037995 [Turnera subulata]